MGQGYSGDHCVSVRGGKMRGLVMSIVIRRFRHHLSKPPVHVRACKLPSANFGVSLVLPRCHCL